MYNGVGVGTARGTGTNGYVQRNLSFVRSSRDDIKKWKLSQSESASVTLHEPDMNLLDHKMKRQVELLLLPLRDKLEAEGLDEDEIEERISEERSKLRKDMNNLDISEPSNNRDSHQLAFDMAVRDSRAAVALGIDINKRRRSRSRS